MANKRGNKRNNRIRGTKKRDRIRGLGGDDILLGLNGNDVLRGDIGDDILRGSNGKDKLLGGDGNDILDGGKKKDRMKGGDGDDTYIVDHRRDRLKEKGGQGIDTVRASISWTLGKNFENLVLTGNRAINATGNNLANVLTGNAVANTLSGLAGDDGLFGQGGNDILDGGLGSDTMLGGAGDDIYFVDNAVDLVSEKAINTEAEFVGIATQAELVAIPDAGGIDVVRSTVDYILPTSTAINGNIENLELLGNSDLVGTGNDLDNVIIGNSGSNFLNGANGDDSLQGGAGDDFLAGDGGDDVLVGGEGVNILEGGFGFDGFLYGNGAPFQQANIGTDIISDFTQGNDLIGLSKSSFGLSSPTGGGLIGSDFASVFTDSFAEFSNALVVFSSQSGIVYYNANRGAAGFGVPTAEAGFTLVLGVPFLSASDFLVV